MELADFAVRLEEVMLEACSSYECVYEDEDDIARVWKFLIDDTIDGYVAIEDNDDTFGFPTVSLGLYLKDITDFIREDLIDLLHLNADLINANLSLITIPVPVGMNQLDESEEDFDEASDIEPLIEERDILTISSRLPFDIFEPDEFRGYVENLLFQYQTLVEADDDEEEFEDDFEFAERSELSDKSDE